jgi:serine/threonine protein kinase
MLELGQRLGDFEVIRLLGKGGMGEVYEAQQFNPPRRVALKVLAPHLCESDDLLQRFWRESEALAQLDHPNIVRVLTRGWESGTAYYTMQLIRGLPLSRLINEARAGGAHAGHQATVSDEGTHSDPASRRTTVQARASVPSEEAPEELLQPYLDDRYGFVVRVGVAVARALSAAHRACVLHRDLKPANLMLDRHGHLYLVDFGLALILNSCDRSQTGSPRGTPLYMSPEQAGGGFVDDRSDLYSLGVTLYELTTAGRGPVSADRSDRDAVLREVSAGRVLPLRPLAPDAPEALVRVIEKAIRFAPADRYQTAADLLADLEAIGRPVAANRAASRPTPTWGPRKPLSYRGAIVAVLLAALLPIAAGTMWLLHRPEGTTVRGGHGPSVPPPAEFEQYDQFGDDPLPAVLRERGFDHRLPLFREVSNEPLWTARVWGKGGHLDSLNGFLHFNSDPKERTLILIDNDVRMRWFDFSVDLQKFGTDPAANQLGVFFGFRRNANEPERDLPFLTLELQEQAASGKEPSRLLVGWSYLGRPHGTSGEVVEWMKPLARGVGPLQLPKLSPRDRGWRTLQVRARDHQVVVTVHSSDVDATLKINMDDVGETYHGGRGDLDPRGAIGVWVHKGVGYFRNASVKSLRSGR